MLKELNTMVAATASAVATTACAIDDGATILRIKGSAAKQIAALEAAKAVAEACSSATKEQVSKAEALLAELKL